MATVAPNKKLLDAGRKAAEHVLYTERKADERKLDDFLRFARKTFRQRYKKYPRITEAERQMVLQRLSHLGPEILKNAWNNALSGLHPDLTTRPFSQTIASLDGRVQRHTACVDPRAHIPAEHYAVWNWAFYALSRQGEEECWLSARTTARWTCQSKDKANRSIVWLEKHGWLEKTQRAVPGPHGKGAKFRVIGHDDWIGERGSGFSPEPGETCVMVGEVE